jgi:hypothetical protein
MVTRRGGNRETKKFGAFCAKGGRGWCRPVFVYHVT